MSRRLVILVVVGFWAVMMATVVRRWLEEVRPELEPGTYRSVLTRERRNYQWRKGVYLPTTDGLQRVGYTQTVFHYRSDGKYSIRNVTQARVAFPPLLPKPTTFDLDASAIVGSDFSLERLALRLDSETVSARAEGRVAAGKLVIHGTINGQEQRPYEIELPPGEVAGQGMSPLLALPPLKVGMKWSVVVVDPFSFRPSRVELEVLRRQRLMWEGRAWETYVVAIRSGLMSALAWVSPEGEVLREQTLFGLTFIKEPVPEGDEPKTM